MIEEDYGISEEELKEIEEELREMEQQNKQKEGVIKSRESVKVPKKEIIHRISTGISELDRALEGGIPKGSWVAITGEPGTGKSILCMHFAWAGIKAGDPVVYVTTEAEFRDILKQAKMFGIDFEQYRILDISSSKQQEANPPHIVVIDIFGLLKIARQLSSIDEEGKKRFHYALSIETLITSINEAYKILGVLKEGSKTPQKHVRLIIDSISAFWADKPAMARRYSYDLKVATHRENVTAYLVSQYAMTTKSTFGFGLEHIADGVFHLWMDEVEKTREVKRYMIIKKMRMTNHVRKAFLVEIEPGKGFVLNPLT